MQKLPRFLKIVLGILVTGLGIILMPVPGPGGTPVTLAGLAILASELPWAKRLLEFFKSKLAFIKGHPHKRWIQAGAAVAAVCFYVGTGLLTTHLFKENFFVAKVNAGEEKTMQIFNAVTGKVEEVAPVVRSDKEWREALTPEQYEVARGKGTERPFSKVCAIPPSGEGFYQCVGCGTDLFAYGKKFESGTGWPSFWDPVSPLNVKTVRDTAHGMVRDEVVCARCGSHLGHVFDDGPPPSGKRYCINTVALKLHAKPGVE